MANSGISYSEVASAAQQLAAQNKSPTADNVRIVIGSGSKSTIIRHLRTWKEGHTLEAQAGNLPLPLINAVQALWGLLKDEANAEIAIHEEATVAKIEAIEKVCHRFQEQHEAGQRETEALEASLVEVQDKASDLSALLQAEQTDKARLQEQASGLNRQCTLQSEELSRLHDIVKQTQTNLEHYQETNLRLKEAHSLERENERNQHLAIKHELESQLSKISQEKAVADVMLKHSEEALAKANKIIANLKESCLMLEGKLANSNIENALMEQTNQALLKQVSTLEDQNAGISLKLAGAFEQIHLLSYENTGLESAIQKLEDKTQVLSDEKLFLIQEKSEILGQIKSLQRKNA